MSGEYYHLHLLTYFEVRADTVCGGGGFYKVIMPTINNVYAVISNTI